MTIRFTTGPIKLAYEILGEGEPPLVVIPGWISHLILDRETPDIRDFYERLARHRRMIHYDKRGTGLSDRPSGPETFALDTRVADLVTVMDSAGVKKADLLGWSEGGVTALAFAAQYPERVSRLILYGTAARMLRAPDYPWGTDPARAEANLTIVAAEWGLGSRFLAMTYLPEGDGGRIEWFTEYQRAAVSPQGAVEARKSWYDTDVRALLPSIQHPTLVLRRRYESSPTGHSEYLAAHLPNARLVMLEGSLHLPFFGDSNAVTDAIDRFLSEPLESTVITAPGGLTRREREVADLVAQGLTNRQIADTLVIGERNVHTHVSNLLAKLGLASRAQIATWASDHGLRQATAPVRAETSPRMRLVR